MSSVLDKIKIVRLDEDKSRVELYVNMWLKEIFSPTSANQRLFEIMKRSSTEAKRNGFQPEMLEDIIKYDDET